MCIYVYSASRHLNVYETSIPGVQFFCLGVGLHKSKYSLNRLPIIILSHHMRSIDGQNNQKQFSTFNHTLFILHLTDIS